jgi:hypothetical protein
MKWWLMKLDDEEHRPRLVYTEAVLAKIPLLVMDGWSINAIAAYIGTSEGSLLATCSRLGITLKKPKGKRITEEFVVRLPKPLSEKLESRALDLSMTTEHLVVVLLSQIVTDDLIEAVLDFDDLVDDLNGSKP